MSIRQRYLLIILIIISLLFPVLSIEAAVDVTADSTILIEKETGQILYSKNPYQQRRPASTTKILTGILAIEEGDLDEVVTVSERAAAEGGSSIYLEAGEKLKLRELVYGLLLKSGNDAAVAIAEHIAGSVEEFAVMMNKKAREIGAVNTTFQNPNGLPETGHLTTAYDLAQITRYALDNDFFAQVVATPQKRISWPNHEWDRILTNTNKLLQRSEIVTGVKTGYTDAAGRCLVSSAKKGNRELISVVLNCNGMWRESEKLLNYGLNNYQRVSILEAGETVKEVKVGDKKIGLAAARDFSWVTSSSNEKKKVRKIVELKDKITLPVEKGESLGKVAVCDENNVLKGRVELLAEEKIDAAPLNYFFSRFASRIQTYF